METNVLDLETVGDSEDQHSFNGGNMQHETQKKVLEILEKNLKRPGHSHLIEWLKQSDYFTAPASTKYHGAHERGLIEHCLKVYDLFRKKNREFNLGLSEETVAICGLLHDACKIGFYHKDGYGAYKVKDELPLGHGEKSVMMLQKHIPLSEQEMMIIRWHMIAYDPGIHFAYPNGMPFHGACKKCPAIIAFSAADLEASYLLEKRGRLNE